jgi:hypothetical protein
VLCSRPEPHLDDLLAFEHCAWLITESVTEQHPRRVSLTRAEVALRTVAATIATTSFLPSLLPPLRPYAMDTAHRTEPAPIA